MKFSIKYNRVDQRTFEFSESDVERILIAEAKKMLFYKAPPAGVKAVWTMDICEGSWDEDTDKRVEPVITMIERFEYLASAVGEPVRDLRGTESMEQPDTSTRDKASSSS